MLGAIAGDIIGSVHEGRPSPGLDFPLFVTGSRFTDDTVLTLAIGHAARCGIPYAEALRRWGRRYPDAGYGGWFRHWLFDETAGPYNSYGNGSAMRVSAIGWAFDDAETVLAEAGRSAAVTHNHSEGIKGAQSVAAAIRLGRLGADKSAVLGAFTGFKYDLSAGLPGLRRRGFDVTCQGTVPAAAIAFREADDVETTIRNAVSIGGDTDTLACIAGSVAEAFYGPIPEWIRAAALARLDNGLRLECERILANVR